MPEYSTDEMGNEAMAVSQQHNENKAAQPESHGTVRTIDVVGLGKVFDQNGQELAVMQNVDFHAEEGEFVSIIGPSGCGKSTLLNIIAGLDDQSEGSLKLRGEEASDRLGTVGYMQQKDLLLPWRSVMDNAILGLELQGVSKNEARARASVLMEQFGLDGFESEYPSALSGGMRQRVAFLRTVLADQQMFLLDEPFGALDALNRSQIHEWLLGLWERLNKTIVMVTHDVDEAIFLSDRVYVMSARPGTMRLVANIDLPRPRFLEMVTSEGFVGLKTELLSAIRQESGP
ncbi:MAG: ABC transporter ATP-binding protein [SAR202 cluster bacterium]|nr:ABC transporter ATP-binding protein [SAR202 cluster bacterium]MDP6513527.1 ABC transporter ATP-binding protein [SAR202 cluster bacterium]